MTEPIEWRILPRAPKYKISSDGQILHQDSTVPRKWALLGRYPTVAFWSDGRLVRRCVHSLVAEVFLGPRPAGMQVCHIDGNPLNNHVSNLRYGTAKENAADRERHKKTARGERNGNSRIDDPTVHRLREDYHRGQVTQRQLAKRYGISQAQVNKYPSQQTAQHRSAGTRGAGCGGGCMMDEYFCGLGPIHIAKRRCPHERIEFCPLYVAAHDGSLCGFSCDDGKLEMGECRIDRGADYGAALAQLFKRAPEMVADCGLREHQAQAQAQRERNMRMAGVH